MNGAACALINQDMDISKKPDRQVYQVLESSRKPKMSHVSVQTFTVIHNRLDARRV
jgi:hypothetical protein